MSSHIISITSFSDNQTKRQTKRQPENKELTLKKFAQKKFAELNDITDEQRDQMSEEEYQTFSQQYQELHHLLWPSSTLRVPNRMDPKKRQEREAAEEKRYAALGL
ncbi:hypothetical protein [Acanthamoeba castellanii mamavirus]|nr:hypothetical protein [Acanthamoeba castellanii mamavirus]